MSAAALPGSQFIVVHRLKKVGPNSQSSSLKQAKPELPLRNGDEANDWLVAFCDDNFLAEERGFYEPGQLSFRGVNSHRSHL
jgi:hypothetical protein